MGLIVFLGMIVYLVVTTIVDIIRWCIAKYNQRKKKFEEKVRHICITGNVDELEALLKKGLNPNTTIVTKETYFNDFSGTNEYSPFEQVEYFTRSLLDLCKYDEAKIQLLRQYGAK